VNASRRALAAACALAGLCACGPDRVAGGEVLNPPGKATVTGMIRDEAGAPAAGALVRAYPAGYDPVADAGSLPSGWSGIADARGRFTLTGFDSARVNVLAFAPQGGARLLLLDVRPGDTGDVAAGARLRPPGTLIVPLPEADPRPEAYVYLEGTPFHAALETDRGLPRAVLDSVPAGRLPRLRLVSARAPRAVRDLGAGLRLRPGDRRDLGTLPEWKDYARIFVSPAAAGAALADPVRGYPLLVRLDTAFPFAAARADGGDLRFTNAAGAPLAYQIEAWDPAARAAAIWVRVDSVAAGEAATVLRLFWGDSAAASESSGPKVFRDSLGPYAGVWHFAGPAGGPDFLADASEAANPAFAAGTPDALRAAASPLGGGADLGGRGAALLTGRQFPQPGDLTESIWFRTTTRAGGRLIGFDKWKTELDSLDFRDRHIWMGDDGRMHFGVYRSKVPADQARHVISGEKPCNDGAWHLAAATIGPGGLRFYVDGEPAGADTTVSIGQAFAGYWRMGYEARFDDWPEAPTAASFDGDLDEGRVLQRALGPEVLRLDWATQRPGSAAVTLEGD
jgi:hypothetical protein